MSAKKKNADQIEKKTKKPKKDEVEEELEFPEENLI